MTQDDASALYSKLFVQNMDAWGTELTDLFNKDVGQSVMGVGSDGLSIEILVSGRACCREFTSALSKPAASSVAGRAGSAVILVLYLCSCTHVEQSWLSQPSSNAFLLQGQTYPCALPGQTCDPNAYYMAPQACCYDFGNLGTYQGRVIGEMTCLPADSTATKYTCGCKGVNRAPKKFWCYLANAGR